MNRHEAVKNTLIVIQLQKGKGHSDDVKHRRVSRTARVPTEETTTPARGAYLTKTSLVAVHFPVAGNAQMVFLPKEAMLRVIGPSSCLPEGFEVMVENRI